MTTAKEVLEHLAAGQFESLIGLVENGWLEAKTSPYPLDSPRQKLELAKDASALANAGGGIIVLGFVTKRAEQSSGERIAQVNPFALSLVDGDRYRKILGEWVYPALDHVEITRFASPDDAATGVAAIVVDDAVTAPGKPYLVTKTMDEDDKAIGVLVGFFERKQDRIPTISVARLQQLLSAGQSFSAISDRLNSIEGSIAALRPTAINNPSPTGEAPETRDSTVATSAKLEGIAGQVLESRVWQARAAAERTTSPVFYLSAAAQGACEFPTLFESSVARVVRLIENPPKLRREGFGLFADRVSQIIKGRLRRSVIPGYRDIELWKDGLLIFIGEGDEDFLAWASNESPDGPIRINNFVLAEAILVFCWLAQLVFLEANPKPESLRLAVGFDNLTRNEKPALLHDVPSGKMKIMNQSKPALESKAEFYRLEPWEGYDVEEAGGALLTEIYNWFGFESREVPYIEWDGTIPRLSAQMLTGSPLPLPSQVETPSYS